MRKNYFFVVLAILFTVNAMAQNIPSYMPTNGLVGYWPFNGNANDASGNGHHGTVNGATLSTDKNGNTNNSYLFNGTGAYISIGLFNTPPISNSTATISAWVKTSATNTDAMSVVVSRGSGPTGLYVQPGNQVTGTYGDSGGGFHNADATCSIKDGQWHHLVMTYDNISKKVYNDGVLIAEGTEAISLLINGTLEFGRDNPYARFFNGQLDDIAIYSRALSQQEITALYSGNTATTIPSYIPTNGLVGYWPFDGNANDESGNGNNGTINGATLSTDRNGETNKAYSFNGTSDFIEVLNSISLNVGTSITLNCWVKTYYSSNSTPPQSIIRKGGSYTPSWSLNQEQGKYIMNAYNGNWFSALSPINLIDTSKWTMLTGIINTNNIQIFKEGQLVGSTTYSGQTLNTTDKLYFGLDPNKIGVSPMFYKGKIDDIAIYNRALSQQEITALYSGTPASPLASTKVFVDAPATVNENENVELSISTEALNSSDNVIAFQTDLTYDSTRYTFVSNNLTGTLNPAGNVVVNSSKNGKLNISYMTQTALNGAGSLVKLKFKANKNLGQGIFSLSNFLYNTTAVTSLKSDTVNTLDITPPSARINYSQNPARKGDSLLIMVKFSEKMAESPVPQLNLTGQNTLANSNLTKVNDTTYTYWWVVEKGNGAVNVNLATGKDLGGNGIVETPTQNPSFTVLPTLFGDIDTNKLVQAYDAALTLQYSVGLNPLPTMDPLPWSNWRIVVANVDTVGNVTANDASLILQHSAKLISTFPADAKKRGGEAPVANITVTQEGNQLVFRATGTLYAFNVFMKDHFNLLGQPEVKDKNAMIATNINSTTYNVGLASTTPFVENEPFLILPILTNDNLQGTMDIVANAQEKALAYGKAASIATIQNDAMVVYPNPTKDVVTINNAQGKTLRIIDFQGRLVNTQIVTSNAHEVSLKAIATKGEYIFQLIGENNETITTQKVVMQ